MRMTIPTLAGASALLLLTACSGGGGGSSSSPTYATTLSYTDPSSASYRLVKDPASSGKTLVLDLLGPTGASISGVSFSATADPAKVTWTTPIQAGGTFTLGTPQALATKLASGDLQGAISQNTTGSPVTLSGSSVLAKVTLTLKGNVSAGAIALTDSGKGAYLDGTGVHATAIAVGTLKAQ